MAYFDNAATTYPKPECVYQTMDEFYRNTGGSAGRGNHSHRNILIRFPAIKKQPLNLSAKS
mgnify:CR=1 FL=1